MHDLVDTKSMDKTDIERIDETEGTRNNVPEILKHYTPDELKLFEKKLVRKIDLRTLPVLVVLFLLNVLDRNAIANARLGGLEVCKKNISTLQCSS